MRVAGSQLGSPPVSRQRLFVSCIGLRIEVGTARSTKMDRSPELIGSAEAADSLMLPPEQREQAGETNRQTNLVNVINLEQAQTSAASAVTPDDDGGEDDYSFQVLPILNVINGFQRKCD